MKAEHLMVAALALLILLGGFAYLGVRYQAQKEIIESCLTNKAFTMPISGYKIECLADIDSMKVNLTDHEKEGDK